MPRRTLFVAAFVAVAMFALGGNANAARGEKVPQSPCAFMLDIDKRVDNPEVVFSECVLCRCVLKGVEQDVFRIRYEWASVASNTLDGECDDSGDQINGAVVIATRWVRVEKDPGGQNNCIRGKEDVFLGLGHFPSFEGVSFVGNGVGVVGVGNPLKGELCCNFEKNQAVIHLRGLGHSSFGGPAPRKKCWARVKYISLINPSDSTDPCSIFPFVDSHFVINGVEGCLCDSSVDVPQVPD